MIKIDTQRNIDRDPEDIGAIAIAVAVNKRHGVITSWKDYARYVEHEIARGRVVIDDTVTERITVAGIGVDARVNIRALFGLIFNLTHGITSNHEEETMRAIDATIIKVNVDHTLTFKVERDGNLRGYHVIVTINGGFDTTTIVSPNLIGDFTVRPNTTREEFIAHIVELCNIDLGFGMFDSGENQPHWAFKNYVELDLKIKFASNAWDGIAFQYYILDPNTEFSKALHTIINPWVLTWDFISRRREFSRLLLRFAKQEI